MNEISNVSFGASFVRNAQIKKLIPNTRKFVDEDVAFIKFDSSNYDDVSALREISYDFGLDSFANNIAEDARYIYLHYKGKASNIDTYALTTQKDGFDKIDSMKVLGLTEICSNDKGNAEVIYLQTNPAYFYILRPPEYKHIGSGILDCLKSFCKSITLKSNPNARRFYKKQGFEEIDKSQRRFLWVAD